MKVTWIAFLCAAVFAAPVYARLPAPTPEQQAAAEQKKSEEAKAARDQQEALTRVQDRIAAKYGSAHKGAASGVTQQGNLPQKAIEARGQAGPSGGKEPSAEAHSTPAR